MIVNKKSIYTSRLLSDILLLNLSFILSAIIAQSWEILLERNYMFILLLILNIIWYFYANLSGFYNDFYSRQFSSQFLNIVKSTFIQIVVTIIFIFFVKEDLFTRNFIVLYSASLILFISIRAIVFKKILKALRKKGKSVRNLLIIGAGEIAQKFKSSINNNPDFGYRFIGFLDDSANENIIGNIAQLDELIKQHNIEEVVIALSEDSSEKLDDIIRVCNINAVKVHLIPDYFRFLSSRFQVTTLGKFPIITARDEPLEEASNRFIKRTFDIIFSLIIILLILSWLFPLLALIIKISSKGKVLYRQKRIGVKNQNFECLKFRSMLQQNSGDEFKPVVANDQRVTKVGKVLRKTNLDELPQFFNVITGEMSVVGPRPHAIPYQDKYGQFFEEIKLRHNVRPGITGWAQVHGLRGDVEDEEENKQRTLLRMKYDLWYIENWSLKLDVQIILMTIWQMIKGETKAV